MLGIVTATVDRQRAGPCLASWAEHARGAVPRVCVRNGKSAQPFLGIVPAFRKGMDLCLARHAMDVIACFHDDLVVLEWGWDARVLDVFRDHPEVGLIGFAGAAGLGTDALYREPYAPEQLARQGYRSNLIDAETRGVRSLQTAEVACVDGFALIGRRAFWQGYTRAEAEAGLMPPVVTNLSWSTKFSPIPRRPSPWDPAQAPWVFLDEKGFVNHFYSDALSCLARRAGWQVYYVPIRCRHLGGQTTVEDPYYPTWAERQVPGGDRGFWEAAHRIGYDEFKDLLPIRVGGESAAACG